MDPRDTPGYRIHRVLTNLNSIDVEQMHPTDKQRINIGMTLLKMNEGLIPRAIEADRYENWREERPDQTEETPGGTYV